MSLPQRGIPELKVFFVAGPPTEAERWVIGFAQIYERHTKWRMDVHGTGGPADACRCLICGVPPETNEWTFFHEEKFPLPDLNTPARRSKYSRLCLDCAFGAAITQGWINSTYDIPESVYAENAVREGDSSASVE